MRGCLSIIGSFHSGRYLDAHLAKKDTILFQGWCRGFALLSATKFRLTEDWNNRTSLKFFRPPTALEAVGAERIFAEKISGTKKSRPELDRMIEQLRDGDVVVVTKYDRLSRSLQGLLSIVEAVDEQGAGFRSLAEDIDTTTSAGRLVFHVFASIAQFERERISERTKEGLVAARKRERVGGRPPGLSAERRSEVTRMQDQEGRGIAELARLFEVSPNTIRRA